MTDPTAASLQVFCQRLLGDWIQSLLNNADNATAVSGIGVLQVLADPNLDICNFWERILGWFLAGVELSEAYTKPNFINISIGNDIIGSSRHWWVDEELDKSLCGKDPSLWISVYECLRIAKSLGERDDSSLSVSWACQFLCVRKDDSQVDWLEDTVSLLVRGSRAHMCQLTRAGSDPSH